MIKAEDLLMKSTSRGWWVVCERPGGGGGGLLSMEKGTNCGSTSLWRSCGYHELRWLQKGGLSSHYIPPEGSCHSLNC